MLELLQYPFMQRAFIAGIFLGVLLAYIGVFVVLKRMAFFSDGIAHASLAGVAAGILFGFYPLYTAILVSIIFASLIYYLEKNTTLASDSLIGILFTTSMSLGLIMMSLEAGYRPELTSFLFGSILAITSLDVYLIIIFTSVFVLFFIVSHKKIFLMALDHNMAYLSGMNPDRYKFIMYIITAVSVVLGVKIAGVVLISALLITPVSTAKLYCGSLKGLIISSVIIAPLTVIAGIVLSGQFNIPTGPAIVVVGAVLFTITFIYSRIKE